MNPTNPHRRDERIFTRSRSLKAASCSMAQPGYDVSIRPYTFHASDGALADLRRRIAETKWPSRELVADASQGVQLETMRELGVSR